MSRVLIALAATVLAAVPAAAQTAPDFSGTWKLDETRSVSATHEGFVGPETWVITHNPKSVVVDITRGPKQFTITFALVDGRPTILGKETFPSFRGYWEGQQFVTETVQNIQGQTVTTREVRSLLNGGREMLVERVVDVNHGYTMKGAQSYNTARDYFVRVVR